ncbi:MAG: hypothetical protein KDD11_19975 [Acidobacteria bacterium]|nr:hypothetical protein [Acidobacteriota bacterium]
MIRKHVYLHNNERCSLDLTDRQALERRKKRVRRVLDLLIRSGKGSK